MWVYILACTWLFFLLFDYVLLTLGVPSGRDVRQGAPEELRRDPPAPLRRHQVSPWRKFATKERLHSHRAPARVEAPPPSKVYPQESPHAANENRNVPSYQENGHAATQAAGGSEAGRGMPAEETPGGAIPNTASKPGACAQTEAAGGTLRSGQSGPEEARDRGDAIGREEPPEALPKPHPLVEIFIWGNPRCINCKACSEYVAKKNIPHRTMQGGIDAYMQSMQFRDLVANWNSNRVAHKSPFATTYPVIVAKQVDGSLSFVGTLSDLKTSYGA